MKNNISDMNQKVQNKLHGLRRLAEVSSSAYKRRCNLCRKSLRTDNRFVRFCEECRAENELYRSAEWLPEAPICA